MARDHSWSEVTAGAYSGSSPDSPSGSKQLSMNAVDNNIKFMREDVRGDSLPFLDCAVHTEEDRSLNIEMYRKPTHTDQYLLFDSHHPLEHKLVVIRTLNRWAETVLA